MFGPRKEKITEGWKILHDEELLNLYFYQIEGDQVKEYDIGREHSMHG